MKNSIEKSLKRWLKRKVSITLGMMVAFLISGVVSYSYMIDESVTIKVEGDKIVAQTSDGKDVGKVEKNERLNIWTNDGIIKVINGNGVIVAEKDDTIEININNSGIILGENGIYTKGSLGLFYNNGLISGQSKTGNNLGNGIYNTKQIVKLENYRVILGSSENGSISGNGVYSTGTIYGLLNSGIILGETKESKDTLSGNGIFGEIGFIENEGLIAGKNGNGVYLIEPSSNLFSSNVVNSGILSGKNAILGKVNSLKNTGVISGIESGVSGKINNSLENYGLIIGKNGYGISEGVNKNNATNYGIISGTTQAIIGDSNELQNNYGLLISGENVVAGENQELEYLGKYIINGVKDSQATSIDSSKLLSEIKSENVSKYYDEEFGDFSNLIINTIGDNNSSLNIDSSLVITNSIINGKKNAVVFTEENKKFQGEDVVINGGENAFLGSNGADEIYLGQLISSSSVKSIVNGNINLGNGNDTLISQKGTIINGNIDMGDGFDTIKLNSSTLNGDIKAVGDNISLTSSNINGELDLTNTSLNIDSSILSGNIIANGGKITITGSNNLFNVGATTINGDITLNNGELVLKNNSTINGSINLGGDKTTVWVDRNQELNGKVNVTATNKFLGLNYNLNTTDDITTMKNQLVKFNGFDNLKLANGGNSNVDLTEVTGLKSIVGGNGSDIFKTTMEKLIKIDGGNGYDSLEITSGVFDNTKENSTIDLINIEELKLANENNNIDIAKLSGIQKIFGGSGDDTFSNVGSDILLSINGGEGNDTINMGVGVTLDNNQANTIFTTNSIEKLNLTGDNTISLNDLSHISKINFGTGKNILTLGEVNKETEFDFTEKNIITGNVGINLNGNRANINSTSNGNEVTMSKDFINGNGLVTLNNGTIKLNLSQDTDFSKGVETTLKLNTNGLKGEKVTVESYAFLNVDNEGNIIDVKNWSELSGENDGKYDAVYDSKIKEFSNDGVYGVLTKWEADSIVSWIKDGGNVVDGDYTFEKNEGEQSGIVSTGNVIITTDKGNINSVSFGAISANNLEIKNNSLDGDGEITFRDEVALKGNIENTSENNTTLTFDGKTTIVKIDNSNSTANTTININDEFSSGDIVFNDKKENGLNINDSSNVTNIGTISGNVDIRIATANTDNNSVGFNTILTGANAGLNENKDNNSIIVSNKADGLEINTNYGGTLTFNEKENNINIVGTGYTGTINLGADSTVGVTNSILDGTKINSENGKINISEGVIFGNNGLSLTGNNNDVSYELGENNSLVIDGGDKNNNNTLTLGKVTSTLENNEGIVKNNYTLSGSVTNFTNIDVNENLSLASSLKLDGTEKITIGAGKELGLNIDYSKTEGGKVTGHALYDKGIEVNNNDGKLVIGTATANGDAVISMGANNSSKLTNGQNIILSDSSNHNVFYDDETNEINVTVKENLELGKDEAVKYSHLNDIYKSIVSANKIGAMAPSSSLTDKTKDEAIKAQLEFYGKIYTSTPYAYSNDISRETVNMVNDSIMDSRFKADEGKWLHYGAIAGQGYDDDNSYYGRGYYNSVDLGTTEVNVKSDIYSAYYMGEYGKTDKLALGYVIAGNNSNTDIGESKLDGSGYYLGTYAKCNTGNLKLVAGLGYQHNYYKADRKVSNEYQSMAVEKKYTDNTLTAYSGVRYIHNLAEDLTVEPYARLSLTHVMQDDIKEADRGDLSISVDGKDFTTIESEVGVDLVKSANVKDGKVNLIAGVGAEFMLDGYERENLTAKINGSTSSFDIISDKEENFRGKVSLGVEYEKTNGVFYNAKGSYIRTEDNNNYKFEVGIGYKF